MRQTYSRQSRTEEDSLSLLQRVMIVVVGDPAVVWDAERFHVFPGQETEPGTVGSTPALTTLVIRYATEKKQCDDYECFVSTNMIIVINHISYYHTYIRVNKAETEPTVHITTTSLITCKTQVGSGNRHETSLPGEPII